MMAFLRTLIFCLIATFVIVLMIEMLGLRKVSTEPESEIKDNEYVISSESVVAVVEDVGLSESMPDSKDALNASEYNNSKSPMPPSVAVKKSAANLIPKLTGNTLFYDSFELDPSNSDWSTTGLGADSKTGWSDEQSLSGSHALKISASRPSNQGWPGWVYTIELRANNNYQLQASYYTPDGANAWLEQSFLDQNGQLLTGFSTGCSKRSKLRQWTQIKHRIKSSSIPKNSQYLRIGIRQCLNHTKGKLTHLFFDDVMLTTSP